MNWKFIKRLKSHTFSLVNKLFLQYLRKYNEIYKLIVYLWIFFCDQT